MLSLILGGDEGGVGGGFRTVPDGGDHWKKGSFCDYIISSLNC